MERSYNFLTALSLKNKLSLHYFLHEVMPNFAVDDYADGDILFYESHEEYFEECLPSFTVCKLVSPARPEDKNKYIYQYRVDYAGVWMRRDGSGEPPSSDMYDSKEVYKTFNEALIALLLFITEQNLKAELIEIQINN